MTVVQAHAAIRAGMEWAIAGSGKRRRDDDQDPEPARRTVQLKANGQTDKRRGDQHTKRKGRPGKPPSARS